MADWILVNLMMLQATGQERYLDDAERTLVNHFFMNQFHTGGFGHRALGPEVIGGKNWQGLVPIADDWQSPDVHHPCRWRVLFGKRAASSGRAGDSVI